MSVAELANRIPSADRALEAIGLQRAADVSLATKTRLLAAFGLGMAIGVGIALLLATATSESEESDDAEAPRLD